MPCRSPVARLAQRPQKCPAVLRPALREINGTPRGSRSFLYNRLRRACEGLRCLVGLGLLAVALAGCATPGAVDDDLLVTGSIRPRPVALPVPDGAAPKGIAAGDWAQAKLALEQALDSHQKDVSIPWENRETGARGTATPIGTARAGGCRDFTISLVDGKTEDRWIQGEACRARSGTVVSQVRVLGRA